MIALLDPAAPIAPGDALPSPDQALKYPNGLLAAGGALTVDWLLAAYGKGVFPWYSEGDPILWWSPAPRMVLQTSQFKLRKSLLKRMRQLARDGVQIMVDHDFDAVISACAGPRDGADGTWILPEIVSAYSDLHRAGHAHSFEVWRGGDLLGGLYGVSIGRMFYGESMFTRRPDASKAALAALVHQLGVWQYPWIDCQQQTGHLASMGASPLPRAQFMRGIAALTQLPAPPWQSVARKDLLPQTLAAIVKP